MLKKTKKPLLSALSIINTKVTTVGVNPQSLFLYEPDAPQFLKKDLWAKK